ncbi:MAG: sulfur carrier protein ThiS [Chitinispirillia bacterium]|nr:sulfur carrier protein ThiS [Chitinispirillia bacterium]MCL2242419.1 sulfur carrier protein ThiS [Chitinispirillia bacterium]
MTVNGKNIPLPSTISLKIFLETNGYDPSTIAVERNGAIIAKSSFESEILSDGDTLEIVGFVGGG